MPKQIKRLAQMTITASRRRVGDSSICFWVETFRVTRKRLIAGEGITNFSGTDVETI